jgi:uncharacterized protein (TIGR02147 family)
MTVPIYRFRNYKDYINGLVAANQNKGRGVYRKMALHLGLSSVTISQVFRGARDLSIEQGLLIADFWNLEPATKKYFLLMVQRDRSSNFRFKEHCDSEMALVQRGMEEIQNRVPKAKQFSEVAKSLYYSHWKYSAVRLMTDIEGKNNPLAMAQALKLPLTEVRQVLEFLIANSLIIQGEGDTVQLGPQATHLPASSPWLRQHHRNWRTIALEGLEHLQINELSYTAPMVVSEAALNEIREVLLDAIERIIPQIKKSQSETLACLNIDLFKFPRS